MNRNHFINPGIDARTQTQLYRSLCSILAVVLVVGPAVAVMTIPADAQSAPSPSPTTTVNGSTGDANNSSSGNGTNGDTRKGHFWDGIGNAATNPVQTVTGVGSQITKSVLKKTLVPIIKDGILAVPTMGLNGPAGIVGQPTNWPYAQENGDYTTFFKQVYLGRVLPLTFAFVGAAIMSGAALLPLRRNTYRAVSLIARAVGAMFVGLIFNLTANAVYLKLLKVVTDALAPTDAQIANVGSLLKISASAVAVGTQIKDLGMEALIAAGIVYAAVWLILILFPVISPVIYSAAILGPGKSLRRIAGFAIWSYILIGFSKPAAALLITAALVLQVSASLSGVMATFLSITFIILSAAMPFFALTAAWFSRGFAFNAASMVSGAVAGTTAASYLSKKKSQAAAKARKKVGQKMHEKAAAGRLAAKGTTTGAAGLAVDAKNTYRDAKTMVTGADTPTTSETSSSSSNASSSSRSSDGGQTTAGKIRSMAKSRSWNYTAPANQARTETSTESGGDDE